MRGLRHDENRNTAVLGAFPPGHDAAITLAKRTYGMWLLRRCIELSLFVTLLVLLIIQQLRHTHHVRVLQSSGPVGYQLLRGRKWIMGPAIASGHGRATLLDLEFGGVLRSHHPLKQANQGVKSNEPRFHSSSSWGKRCWEPDQPHVLVAVPYNPAMPEFLQQVLAAHLARLECGNPGLNLELAITSARPPKDDADPSGRGEALLSICVLFGCSSNRHMFLVHPSLIQVELPQFETGSSNPWLSRTPS